MDPSARRGVTRREALKLGLLGSAGLLLPLERTLGSRRSARAAGGFESPRRPPFEADLAIPPVIDARRGESIRLDARVGRQEIIPGITTPIWGYEGVSPGPTILARKGIPVNATFVNNLPAAGDPGNIIIPEELGRRSLSEIVVHLHGVNTDAPHDGHPLFTFPSGESFEYFWPNNDFQRPATLWYHDHAIHATSQQVYRGLAGFYVLTDELEERLNLPDGEFDVGLKIQDVIIDKSGLLVYANEGFKGVEGDVVTVNGRQQPRFEVARGKYRFRILNGSDAREYRLALSDDSVFHVIGSDHGLLPAPEPTRRLHVAPAERYEVVIDFARYQPGTRIVLQNRLDEPQDRRLEDRFDPRLPTSRVMAFDVTRRQGFTAPIPARLRPLADPTGVPTPARAARTRNWEFDRQDGFWSINGRQFAPGRVDARPRLGTSEIWRFVNPAGGWVHPIHPHLVRFLILDLKGRPRRPGESGWKDTVWLGPNVTARVLMEFRNFAGRYVMHCHNVSHEDHDMMTQFETVL
ncbi:multicopper oxidase family protein [Rubrobacter tropicus]|nr:multicopper oxidase family protein [Rubrobacter tropicus]